MTTADTTARGPAGGMLVAVGIAAALVLYGAIRFPASAANGGATAFLLSGAGLLAYAMAAGWARRPSSAGVRTALRLGTIVGCCIAAVAVICHCVEISISLPPAVGAVLGGGMWGVMFLGFGIACSATVMRGHPIPLGIASSVWSAMVSTAVLVACALTIGFVFLPHMQQILSAAYTASGMTDPESFVIRHEVGNASSHLFLAPVIALLVGGLSAGACSLLRSVPRQTALPSASAVCSSSPRRPRRSNSRPLSHALSARRSSCSGLGPSRLRSRQPTRSSRRSAARGVQSETRVTFS